MVNAHPIAEARRRSRSPHPTSEVGMCKREVRECLGVTVSRSADAAECWREAKHKHPETDPRRIPRGVPVFWTGGSSGHGHVALATGFRGECFSTDIRRPGYFDKVPIDLIEAKWGLELVGWTEDFDGVRVFDGPRWIPGGRAQADPPAHKLETPAPAAAPKKKTGGRK